MREVLDGLIAPLPAAQADVLVDLPATWLAVLTALERDAGLAKAAARFGFRPTLIAPISTMRASRLSMHSILAPATITARNFAGTDGDYRRWLNSKPRETLFERGGREVVFTRLRDWIVADPHKRDLPSPRRPGRASSTIRTTKCSRLAALMHTALGNAGELLGLPVEVPA